MSQLFGDWHSVAGVRSGVHRRYETEREQGRLLFSAAELPELNHPLIAAGGRALRECLLAQRLYQYLQFTVHLESRVVNRALEQLGNDRAAMPVSDALRLDAYKIYTDEAYHSLSNLDLMQQVRRVTGIAPVSYTFNGILSALDDPLPERFTGSHAPGHLLQAVVFETVVTAILDDLPRDPQVDSVIRQVVADHADDERRHHAYFSRLLPHLWTHLSPTDREAAAHYLPQIVRTCLEPDIAHITRVLRAVGLVDAEAKQVIRESYLPSLVDCKVRRLGRHTLNLIRSVGILDVPGADEAFTSARLIDPRSERNAADIVTGPRCHPNSANGRRNEHKPAQRTDASDSGASKPQVLQRGGQRRGR